MTLDVYVYAYSLLAARECRAHYQSFTVISQHQRVLKAH